MFVILSKLVFMNRYFADVSTYLSIFCYFSELCSWVLDETVQFSSQMKVILIDSRSISFYAMACASERIHAHAKRVRRDVYASDIITYFRQLN